MRKTDKKTDKMLREALMDVCDAAQTGFDGFEWLTHFADYNRFPGSLTVVCVYATNAQLAGTDRAGICLLIKDGLESIGINIKDIHRHVVFDTEENCTNENDGKWRERFRQSAR